MTLRIESVRARLTIFYVAVLGMVLLTVGGLIYAVLARMLYTRIDEGLVAAVHTVTTSLGNDLAEGQDVADAARSTASELATAQQRIAIFDAAGSVLAASGGDDDLTVALPRAGSIPVADALLTTAGGTADAHDRHRLAIQRVMLPAHHADYIVAVGSALEPTDQELETLRHTLAYVVPIALLLAGLGGWFLAHHSLSPVVAMAERARQIGGEDLSRRLPVANPRDELGRLAETFNELLSRLESSMTQQRQFMADASHELRTPVTTTRTAAHVALQQRHRDEDEYRRTLEIVEQQAARLSRIVEDMFTLARADAGTYPLRVLPMYLDEVIEEVAAAARVLASTKDVQIHVNSITSASFVGDEDLIKRLVGNLLDNAVRHSPGGSTVRVELRSAGAAFTAVVSDSGTGIPVDHQPNIFQRFYRVEDGRARSPSHGGAGLGLSLARWVARAHGGDIILTESSDKGTTFSVSLPRR